MWVCLGMHFNDDTSNMVNNTGKSTKKQGLIESGYWENHRKRKMHGTCQGKKNWNDINTLQK